MTEGPELGHNDGTQPTSDSIPKHQYTSSRGGGWLQYRQRIPLDLVRLGCYGNRKEIKESLNTQDKATANTLAKRRAFELELEFEAKREEYGLKGTSG